MSVQNVIQKAIELFGMTGLHPRRSSKRQERSIVQTYLTTEELAQRIEYDPRIIRDRLNDSVLLEGIHYIRPFGGQKTLYLWDAIE